MLGLFLGETLVDVTQHDPDEWAEERACYFMLHFSNGMALKVPIGDDGFEIINHPDGGDDDEPGPVSRSRD